MKNFTRFAAVLMIGLALPAITAPAQEMPAQRRTLTETEMQQIAAQRLERLQEMHPERFEGMDEQRRQRALEQELQRLQRTHAQQEEKRTQRLDSLRQARHAARPDRDDPNNYPISETDSLALVALYYATNGDNWYYNDNWLTGPVNTWYGVSVCDGVVEGLWLWNNNLTGVIPDEIGDLSNLYDLDLTGNNLSGEIPWTIGNLTGLITLCLGFNNLTGVIPDEIGDLNSLAELYLTYNNLTGEIPWTIGNLNNLYYLELSSNNLTGEIPWTIGNLNNLHWFDVSYNQLFYIPYEICNAFNSGWGEFYYWGNYFDLASCPAIECLADKGVYMYEGWQNNGHDLLLDCNVVCEYTITLFDDGGDGWNDGWLYVYSDWDWLDLTLWSGYGPETYSFNVRSDYPIYFEFYPGWDDPNPGECSYIVYNDVGAIVFQDGMNGAVPTGGSIPGECVGNDPYVNIGLDEDWICADGSGYYFENVTALNYWDIYWWANGYGYFDNEWGSLNPTYYPDEMDYQQGWVEICVEVCMEDNNWNWICDYDCMTLYFINPPEVDAGQEATIYANETFTAAQATADNYGSLLWSASGDGAFDDPTLLNPTYTPGLQDIITGSVELCLTGTTLDPAYCDDVTACMQLLVLGYGLQSITLEQGWAGISSFINPFEQDIEGLMAAIAGQLIILRDFAGNYYQPGNKELFNWEYNKGYYIKMASQAAFEVEGVNPLSGQLDLQQGWNLIPVLSDEPVVIEQLFSFHTDKLEIVTEVAGLKLYWPDMEIATLQELLPGKAYLVKANQPFNISFELSDLPSVTTAPVIDISVFSALSGGEVTDEGSTPVTARGVVWSVSPNPTIEHNDGITIDGAGAGAYVSELDGLTPHSTYYLRAYATNLIGTFYGEEIYFTTLWDCGDSYPFVDARDGQTYNTVLIGDQCWMKENLNFQTDDSWCYSNNVENCTNYGRLYTWHSALTSCPSGWRLPTDNEWTIMVSFVVSQGYPNEWYNPNGAGNALKSCRQVNSPLGGDCNTTQHPRWNSNSTHHGFDEFGFSIFPGGYRHTNGNFNGLGNMGICWVSTEVSTDSAWNRYLYSYEASVGRHYQTKVYGFSVRCVRD